MNRPTLHITRGLPASGKTTLALAMMRERSGLARVNRDFLRENVFGIMPILTPEGERILTKLQMSAIRSLLREGRDVIADDTNLPEQRMTAWTEFARWRGVDLVVHDLRDVPVEECLARDRARIARGERGVGDDVILRMAQHLPPKETTNAS